MSLLITYITHRVSQCIHIAHIAHLNTRHTPYVKHRISYIIVVHCITHIAHNTHHTHHTSHITHITHIASHFIRHRTHHHAHCPHYYHFQYTHHKAFVVTHVTKHASSKTLHTSSRTTHKQRKAFTINHSTSQCIHHYTHHTFTQLNCTLYSTLKNGAIYHTSKIIVQDTLYTHLTLLHHALSNITNQAHHNHVHHKAHHNHKHITSDRIHFAQHTSNR